MTSYARRLMKVLATVLFAGFLAGSVTGSLAGMSVAMLDNPPAAGPNVSAWAALALSVLTGLLSGGITIGLTFGRLNALEAWRREHMDAAERNQRDFEGLREGIAGKASKQDLAEAMVALRHGQDQLVEAMNTRFDDLKTLVTLALRRGTISSGT